METTVIKKNNLINGGKLLKAEEVAEILNVSRAFVYQLMQTGELPSVRLRRSVRVRPSDLEEVIRTNTCKGSGS